MHFKAGNIKPKATIEIGDKTYEIKAPKVGQVYSLVNKLDETKSTREQSILMKDFICEIGSIPKDEIDKIEQELFNQLFDYVISSKKN